MFGARWWVVSRNEWDGNLGRGSVEKAGVLDEPFVAEAVRGGVSPLRR